MLTFFGLVFTSSLFGTTFTATAAFEIVIQARTTFVSRTFPSTAGILTTANLQTGKSVYLTLTENTSIKPKNKKLEDFDFPKFLPRD